MIINAIKKTPDTNGIFHYVEQADDANYPTADWQHSPNIAGVSGVSRNYWKYDGTATVVEMSAGEKEFVEFQLSSTQAKTSSGLYVIHNSGRVYLYTDSQWITDSDDNYGTGYYQFQESGATATDPVMEWEHQGVFVPKGRIIRSFNINGRLTSSGNGITDLEMLLAVRRPNLPTRWVTGFDSDAEMTNITIHRDFLWTPTDTQQEAWVGLRDDMHGRTIPLNYEIQEDSYLSVYYKPTGAVTTLTYFLHSYQWEIEAGE